jgi:putative MATE family efflux protein
MSQTPPATDRKQPQQPDKLRELGTGRIVPLLFRFAWPAIVTMSLHVLYNIVDRIYIGQGCGQDAIAGLALTTPVMMALGAFGVLIGVGSSALLSIRLGEEKMADAERILGQCVALKLLLGVTIAPALFFTLPAILRFMAGEGATATTVGYARQYLSIILFFNVLSHLAFGLSACMRAEGSPRQAMMCMVVGFSTNLVLDPVFIFWFKMGVAGAAWATNIAMACSCAWALWYYRPGHSAVRLRWRRIGFYRNYLAKACGIGLSPALQQLAGSLVNVSLQLAFAHWAADEASATAQVASLGIFQMVTMFFIMPLLGVQQGVAPVMGYNWGARNLQRVRESLFLGLWTSTVVVSLAAAVMVGAAVPIVRLFTDGADAGFVRLAAGDLRVSNCMLWCIGLNVVASTYFQSIGKPRAAILLSLLRQCICLIPCIWILPYLAHVTGFCAPATAIWLSMPISDVLACLATVPAFLAHARFLARAGRGKNRD